MRQNSVTFLYLLLGSLTAFGPLVTDMYLPALPAMTECFHTSMPMVQLGLTFSMIGLAAGQLLFGPLSDKYGRRPLLLVSMAVFILSTIGWAVYSRPQYIGLWHCGFCRASVRREAS